ncbi:unknown [Firmicutes bacterium CAG:536]|nr:unknown [Firmicutes bacterium CAG:536]
MSLRKDEEKNQITKKKTMEELLQENKALKEKNLKLEVELLYLKKLDALIQERKQREKEIF